MKILTRLSLVAAMMGIALGGCVSNAPLSVDVYGTYVPTAIEGSAHFFEGDTVTLTANGYRHVRFSDELGSWSNEPPFQEYGGEAIYDVDKIVFVDSWLDPPERYFVRYRGRMLLLTPDEHTRYLNTGKLPDYALQKRKDKSVR